ncbi:YcjF family protein [Pseudomonas massiliensis]|uniref:YcjF family protein n=1 Tax=Pseudomonas massiliensis TaxID=522492 RepID=UPI0005916949|nr:GTPase [Pseudomonas massiliensis]
MSLLDRVYRTLNPAANPSLEKAFQRSEAHLPTLWLLGKTGAGKSSLVRALTGLDRVEVGAGFRPCTLTSVRYAYPTETPVMAFLDTRGLAEADYDAREDLANCERTSHALIVVMKAEDPEQSQVLAALRQIRRSGKVREALLVHTGVLQIDDVTERERCIARNEEQVRQNWGQVDAVAVDFGDLDGRPYGLKALTQKLAERLPILGELFEHRAHADVEERNFQRLKKEVIWYAGAAGAADAIPAVGLVAVPTVQLKMLHSLANQYGLAYDRRLLAQFAAALGTGFGVHYASRLGLRQLLKLIPVVGQTVGSASAAAASYGFTYALGRAACLYFYRLSRGESISAAELQALYKNAFNHILPVARDEKNL